jgi:hypothetical protein
MLSSLFVVSVSRVWVSSTLLFFGSAKPCTDHSAVTVITGPQEPVFFFRSKEKRACLRGSQFVSFSPGALFLRSRFALVD